VSLLQADNSSIRLPFLRSNLLPTYTGFDLLDTTVLRYRLCLFYPQTPLAQCPRGLLFASLQHLLLLAARILSTLSFPLPNPHTPSHPMPLTLLLLFLFHISPITAMDNSLPRTPTCHIFNGDASNFTPWFIAFSAWLALTKPKVAKLLHGTTTQPQPRTSHPTAHETKLLNIWNTLNTQLYGAILTHVSLPLQSSLHVNLRNDGIAAINYLRRQFGAHSSGDRAEATARLQKHYIDPRAKVCEADVTLQYNKMSLAAADIVAAGGTRPDDALLISFLELSLPLAYHTIRTILRTRNHTVFFDYYNELLVHTKAEERVHQQNTAGIYAAQVSMTPRSFGKGKAPSPGIGVRSTLSVIATST